MHASLLLLILGALGALAAPQASGLARGDSSDVVQRLAQELDRFKALMKTGAPDINIPVLDTLVEEEIPIESKTSKIFKATGSLKDLEVSGLSSFTVSKLDQGSGSSKVSLVIEIPSASARTIYDLEGGLQLEFLKVPLDGSGEVSATVNGIKAGADLEVTINSDNSVTINDISNVDYSYTEAKVNVAAMSSVINKLLNQLIPSILKSNRNKIVTIIETLGKENINKYFDLIAGKTYVRRMLPTHLKLGEHMAEGVTISAESREIIEKIILELVRSE